MGLPMKTMYRFSEAHASNFIQHEIETQDLTELIQRFQDFLKGCGYYFEGELQIVDDSSPVISRVSVVELSNAAHEIIAWLPNPNSLSPEPAIAYARLQAAIDAVEGELNV